VLCGPLSCSLVILGTILLKDTCNLRHQRVLWVWVREQGANGEQHLADGECRRPLLFEDVEANASVGCNVGVIYPGNKGDLRWLERVINWKPDGQVK